MSAATMNEMERLRKAAEILIEKNDAANEKNRELMAELEKSRAELNASLEREQSLAAHVEHLDNLRRNVILAVKDDSLEYLDISVYRDDMQPNKPTAAYYTKRDLIKQAEALEFAAANVVKWTECETLRGYAKDLRQQAAALGGKGE